MAHLDVMSRTGARRRSEVPQAVLAGLNAGTLESVNLVEWLCVDQAGLLNHLLADTPIPGADGALARARQLADEGVMARLQGIGLALHAALVGNPQRQTVLAKWAAHPSDTVRSWTVYALLAETDLTLEQRLKRCHPFAADSNMGVREISWMAFRPFLMADLSRGLALLLPWATDSNPNLRRFASEVSRPCGVWCKHLTVLKADPSPGRPILAALQADDSKYVQNSVANWLNDASKSRPDWVQALCTDWLTGTPVTATVWIVHHATRTLRKKSLLDQPLAARLHTLRGKK